jgi:hypothetical protein
MSQLFGVVRARQLTVLAGGAAAWWAMTHNFFFAGIFAAMFALQSFLALRAGASTAAPAGTPMPVASTLAVDDLSGLERTFIEGPPTDLGPAQLAADKGVVQPLTERLLTRGLRGVAAAHALAEHLRYARRYPEAVAVTERLYVDGRSDLAQAAFAAACANARTGDTDRALAWLDRAVDHGFAAAHVLDGEPDLDAVRHMPGWANVRARVA